MSFLQKLSESFPPKPTFTEKDLPSLNGKVYIVTGGASGVGLELSKLLYAAGGRVYVAGRSRANGEAAIARIAREAACTSAGGELRFLHVDLADLAGIKAAALWFLARETRLDGVWHNAGVMAAPVGSASPQGLELHWATNVLGPFLLQHFVTPLMRATAADAPLATVRAVWVASLGINGAPPGGVDWADLPCERGPGAPRVLARLAAPWTRPWKAYMQSKAANVLLAAEAARQWAPAGVVSVSANPGQLRTQLARHLPWPVHAVFVVLQYLLLYPAYYGALTELYAGLSPDIDAGYSGGYVVPWGRRANHHLRPDLAAACSPEDGNARRLWEWCWDATKEYM